MNTEFNLPDTNESIVNLDQYNDAPAKVIVFTCNHCPYAIAYEDRLIALSEDLKTNGIPLIAICSNDDVKYPQDSFDEMRTRAATKGFNFPYLRDESQEIARNYGAERTPHAFVLNNNNEIIYQGAIDNNWENEKDVTATYLRDSLDAFLKGNEITVAKTEAIGCSIKWK